MKKLYLLFSILLIVSLLGCNSDSKKGEKKEESTNEMELVQEGRMIAQSTFASLSSTLKASLEKGGVEAAIEYCNVAAMPLSDSLSQLHNVKIKRVSEKYRNPQNMATRDELAVINSYEKAMSIQETLKPLIKDIDGSQVFYSPIVVQELCLKCHGNTENIPEYPVIKKHYPDDLATGYALGELRGIWSITFNKI